MLHEPQISVVMPIYNCGRFLPAAIESVRQQSHSDWEMILVDDGSEDDSLQIAEQSMRQDSRIRLIASSHLGVTKALNLGLQQANGQFIARMDADDKCRSTRFETQLSFLADHPDHVAVGSFTQRIDADGRSIAVGKWPTDHETIDQLLLSGRGGLAHPAAMIRHHTLRVLGGYREKFAVAQDKDLWLRLAEVGKLANIPEVLLDYREHLASVGNTREQQQHEAVCAAVQDAWQRRGVARKCTLRFRKTSGDDRRRQWIKDACRSGNHETARHHLRLLLREKPLSLRTLQTVLRFGIRAHISRAA